MSAQLTCTICGQMFPSVYWFKSDGICIECFKTLSDEQKREVESRAASVETADDRKPFPSIGESVLIFFSVLIVGIIYSIVLTMIMPGKRTSIGIAACYTLVNSSIIAVCIAIKRSRISEVGARTIRHGHLLIPVILLGALLVILAQMAVSLSWGAIFTILHTSPIEYTLRNAFLASSVGLFLAIAIAPILEETIFRGIILDGFLKYMGNAKAIVISTLLFALLHDRYTIPYAIVLGLILGWIYSQTKSLDTVIILHAFNNLIPGIRPLIPPLPFISRFYAGSHLSIFLGTMMALVIVAMGAWIVIRAIARQPIPQDQAAL